MTQKYPISFQTEWNYSQADKHGPGTYTFVLTGAGVLFCGSGLVGHCLGVGDDTADGELLVPLLFVK